MRFYLARSVSIVLVNFLLVPTVVSLFFSALEWLAESEAENGLARFARKGRAGAEGVYEWILAREQEIERAVMGTRQPKVERVKG